ncbi:hypothetical protein ACFV3R_11575 [Streptomyces sp. NPDC059740]|uniref:hypothetical protein n=1 Tax=Streptomyces sp. NPDC059740 TaxID=3346926 RepID=UPI003664467D
MRHRLPGIRSACLAAVLALAGALQAAPVAEAAPGPSAPVRLTAKALDRLSEQYAQRSDGIPGLVAQAARQGTHTPSDTVDQPGGKAAKGGAASSAPAAGSLTTKGSWETPRGVASTLALGGTRDWVGIFSGGQITRYNAQGTPVWQRTSHSLYTDWKVKPKQSYQQEEYSPVLYQGYDPYQPGTSGTHPFAQADFNRDGTDDIAVAYSVGADPARPFTSPGSDLQSGTFVSLLDGRTGAMLWHTLLPGYVGSLAAQDGRLIAADVTGPSWNANPVAEQGDSRSSLVAYDLTADRHGQVDGRTAWTYSTKAPWALWSDIEDMGAGRVATAWTDTPMGLGSDRPAAGHVLVLDVSRGRVLTDVATPGYPRMVRKDPDADRVLVAEQNDPLDAVRWDLTAISVPSGKRSVITTRTDTIPEALVVNKDAHGKQARYAVAELGINADLSDGASRVSGWNGDGRTLWTHTTRSTVGRDSAPTLAVTADARGRGHVYAAVADPVPQTLSRPDGPVHSQLLALDATDGRLTWQKEGPVVGDQVTAYRGGLLTVGYDLTAYRIDPDKGAATAQPLLGDTYAAVATDVNGDGVEDLVVGGQSRGVFALDGRTLSASSPRMLWHVAVKGAVHQLTSTELVDGRGRSATRLVAATSYGFAVLTPKDGTVVSDVTTGAYQQGIAVARGEVIASGDTLAAYTADGKKTWSYRPAGTAGKQVYYSVPATADGRIYLEYGGARGTVGTGPSDPAPTAVALDPAHGTELWSLRPDSDAAAWIQQQAGVLADSAIPGAGGHAVAFAWGGDRMETRAHLVQTVDGRTGKVLTSDRSAGSATFQGFAASKKYGLVELHNAMMTVHPADGSALYHVSTIPNVQQALFPRTSSGAQTFVGAAGGLLRYDQPFPDDEDAYTSSADSAFALFAGAVVPADLNGDKATDLIALQHDWPAYDLDEEVGGFGADPVATDNYQHGISVLSVSDAGTGATGRRAAASRPTSAPTTAAPVHAPTLPLGTAAPFTRVGKSLAATGEQAPSEEATVGYTPQQISKRLGLTGDGTGETVAVTVAYDYPSARADLNHFAAHFGLPPTCDSVAEGTDCFTFEQVHAEGTRPAANANWSEEAALDIEWAHSVAPKAKIVLVEASDASATALNKAIDVAATYHPAAVNNSWGMPEFSGEAYYDKHCKLSASVCTQSTGDAGHPAGYSSTNPYALAVGGTHLVLDDSGATTDETAWTATGGGLSYFEPRPAYQKGVNPAAHRGAPDVSFVGDPHTGVAVYTTATGTPQWLEVGGTSLSSPIWAAIMAATDQLRAGAGKKPLAVAGPEGDSVHASVYALGGALRDITEGSNGACGAECEAGPGYDTVTGLGSPAAGVDKALAAMK